MENTPSKRYQLAFFILRIVLLPCLVVSLLTVLGNADEWYGIWAGKGTLRYSGHLFYDISEKAYLAICALTASTGLLLAFLQLRALIQGKPRQILTAILLFALFLLGLYLRELYFQSIYTGYVKG